MAFVHGKMTATNSNADHVSKKTYSIGNARNARRGSLKMNSRSGCPFMAVRSQLMEDIIATNVTRKAISRYEIIGDASSAKEWFTKHSFRNGSQVAKQCPINQLRDAMYARTRTKLLWHALRNHRSIMLPNEPSALSQS